MEPFEHPHNLVTYLDPLIATPSFADLSIDPEKALAENAIWWVIMNPGLSDRDKLSLERMYMKYGWNMFLWKFYRAARCYLGGYKALGAHLKLRRVP